MKAIVVKRKLLSSEINEIYLQVKNNKDIKLFSSVKLPEIFIEFSSPVHQIDDSTKRNINYEIFEKLNKFGDKFIDGKTVAESLTVGNASIWHYNKFRIYFSYLNLYYEFNEIKYYSENFENVKYYTSNNKFKQNKNIPQNIHVKYIVEKSKSRLNFVLAFKYALYVKIKILIGIFSYKKIRKRLHILIDHSQKQSCIDIQTLHEVIGNYNLNYLFDKIDNDFLVINEEVIPKFRNNRSHKFSFSLLFKKKKYIEYPGELILLKGLFSWNVYKKLNENKLLLNEAYKKIESSLANSNEKIIFNFLISLHKSSMYYLFRSYAYRKFFLKYDFKTLTTTDENSPVLKSIIDAAKINNIITFGLQHGNIHDLHPAYMFTSNDMKDKVMTDYTFVWGKYYKDFLYNKANYPQDSLITVGQIRTDIIPVLENAKQSLKTEIFNTNKKIVLFASQPQRDADLRYRAAFDVFISVKDNKDVLLIIKLHPGEINDFNYYESIAETAACKNYKIFYYHDLYLMLSLADIVVTCFSTVGSEAVYFHKPLIILDHLKQDIQNYHKTGVAFQTKNSEELKKYINQILNGELKINLKAYDAFIENYAYKIDGNASQRYIDIIKSY